MARRRQQNVTVELFPFLAVLVCVMGALIFLLLVTTKRLRAAAVAKAQAAVVQTQSDRPILPFLADETEDILPVAELPASLAPDLAAVPLIPDRPDPIAAEEDAAHRQAHLAAYDAMQREWTTKVASLESDLDRRQAMLNRQRLLMLNLERDIDSLQQQLLQRETELAAVMGRISAAEGVQSSTVAERTRLEQVIRQLRQQLKELEAQQQASSSQYVVVPFDGKSGTTRRPILVECTATGLTFLPENITISPQDIEGFTPRFNPLLAGSLALVNYWSRQPASNGQSVEEPYVLLIVRPNGTLAYYIAMKLLSGMKQPFGYELVTEDMSLQTGPVDPGAKAALEEAILQSLAERDRLLQAMSSGMGAGGGSGAASKNGSGNGRGLGTVTGFGTGSAQPAQRTTASASRNGDGIPRVNSRGEFAMSDLEDSSGVGQRSWEDIDRFEGQEHRRKSGGANSASGRSTTADQNAGASSSQPASGSTGAGEPSGNAAAGSETAPNSRTTQGQAATQALGNHPTANAAGDWRSRGSAQTGEPASDLADEDYPNFNQAVSRKAGSTGKALPYEQLNRRKWGPHDPGATIGVEKPIRIRVDAESLVVADSLTLPVAAGWSREQIFNQLLLAIDQQAQTWGKPGTGFFWVPSLRFEVLPGGNTTYERVAPLVSKCGLSHSVEQTLGRVPASMPEATR